MLRAGPASREGELCVQEVFSLLDVLNQWVAEARATPSPATAAVTSTSDAFPLKILSVQTPFTPALRTPFAI